jgi:hypothetical protein
LEDIAAQLDVPPALSIDAQDVFKDTGSLVHYVLLAIHRVLLA